MYTTSTLERDNATKNGYVNENIACYLFSADYNAGKGPNTIAKSEAVKFELVKLERYFNDKVNDHFYTTTSSKENLTGYNKEGT